MQELIRSMGHVPFLIINGFLLAMAGAAIAATVHARRRAARMRDTPTANIGMAEDGYREFEGTIAAIPGAEVIAPLTQTRVPGTTRSWRSGSGRAATTRRGGTRSRRPPATRPSCFGIRPVSASF